MIPVGSALPNLDLPHVGPGTSTIVIRYLGFSCTHCVRQLTYLNSYAKQLQLAGIRVVAFSSDDDRTNRRLVERMGYDTAVMTFVSDPANRRALALGLLRSENGEQLDLHAALVLRGGKLAFGITSTEPFLDVARLVQAAVESHPTPTTPMLTGSQLTHYVGATVRPRVIASAAQGVVSPVDLKFNRTVLHSNDLWVVTSPDNAAGTAIIHNAGRSNQSVVLKRDSRAGHFMYRTQALAFGTNGTFATAQSGWEGGGFPRYMFMGPTLWSSDTAIFASAYQSSSTRLASHLDMLHQSPFCLGIAHERDNVYWVTDARYKTVHRYDFADPHEVGGTDHRDGVIRRYAEATISATDRNQPAHMAIDDATGWLYYVDPEASRVQRLHISSGSVSRQLEAPDESDEWLTEFSEVRGATIETAIAGPLGQPVGLDIRNGMMIVGDRSTGRVFVYRLSDNAPELVTTVQSGASELLGITIGPDNHIWCVDRANAAVLRLETSQATAYIAAATDVAVVSTKDGASVPIDLVNGGTSPLLFSITPQVGAGWSIAAESTNIEVEPQSTVRVDLEVQLDSSALPTQLVVSASAREREAGEASSIPLIGTQVELVPSHLRRILVLDGSTEGFDIAEAVAATNRQGYVALPSLVFNRAAANLQQLETCVWYSGSFGDINVTDEAIITDLRRRDVDMLMLADDPLAIRAEGDNFRPFFEVFGAAYGGVDAPSGAENGRRMFDGVENDPVTNGISLVDCQLPRLDHQRGRLVVPNVFLRRFASSASVMFTNRSTERAMAIRNHLDNYRSIIMGINPARMIDEQQRTMILDKSIEWLEAGAPQLVDPDPDPDPTSVSENSALPVVMRLHGNPVRSNTILSISTSEYVAGATVALYSVGGQELRRLHEGAIAEQMQISVDVSALATGTYFIILRTPTAIYHLPLMKE
jgi:hypothetical protein